MSVLHWAHGEEDAEDERIFFYMDDEPLKVGMIISDGFLVTHIEEDNDGSDD
jgi:hypothetical protein